MQDSGNGKLIKFFSLRDPGGCKKTVKEIEEEKLAKCMWELFITNTKVTSLLISSLGPNPTFQAFVLLLN